MQPLKYCAAPWRGLHINQSGDVKFCCAGKINSLGNLSQKTLSECLHGEAAQKIRQEIKQGHLSDYCEVCIESEKYGGSSERDWHNSVNKEFDVINSSLTDHTPSIVDVRWNNTCNLRCEYCNSLWSSQWAAHLGQKVNNDARSYTKHICNYVYENTTNIKEVAMVGGEPLLLPDNIQFLDYVPESAIVTLITNLSLDLESNQVFKKLKNRKQVGWSISCDNIQSRFEFVRRNAQWEKFVKNLDIIQDLWIRQQQWGGVHAVFNIFSATRLCEFREFLNSRNLTVIWQTLHSPDYLDPANLGPAVREIVITEIQKLLTSVDVSAHERNYFTNIQKTYETNQFNDCLFEFKKHIEPRQQQFASLWPELAFLLNE